MKIAESADLSLVKVGSSLPTLFVTFLKGCCDRKIVEIGALPELICLKLAIAGFNSVYVHVEYLAKNEYAWPCQFGLYFNVCMGSVISW